MRILVVEDNKQLNETVCSQLNKVSYQTDACYDGEDATEFVNQYKYDLIILDRMLPNKNGIEILQDMRSKDINTPVIIVTALNGINDRIDGLDAGADDYLVKPFSIDELLARVRALLRRPSVILKNESLDCGGVEFCPDELVIHGKNGNVGLSAKETALLEYFIRHDGQTLKREQIICSIWGPDTEIEDGNLDNYIFFLRRRLKSAESVGTIKTVYATGYRPEININGKEK